MGRREADLYSEADLQNAIRLCIIEGDFTLHSGQRSNWICDLFQVWSTGWFSRFILALDSSYPLVGVEFGGAVLALCSNRSCGLIRKDGTYIPHWSRPKEVSLVDDVVTTESSLAEASIALDVLGVQVKEYLCVLDRREPGTEILEVRSLAKIWNCRTI